MKGTIAENLSDLEKLAKVDVKVTKVSQGSIKKLYKTMLENYRENNNQEKSYLFAFRCYDLIEKAAMKGDEKFIRILYKTEIAKAQEIIKELRPVLEKKYQTLQKANQKPNLIINGRIQTTKTTLFPDEFISCKDLYNAMEKKFNMLLIDVRTEKEFTNSKILFKNIVNIPELSISDRSANQLLNLLEDRESKEMWAKRDTYEALVILDWNTSSENIISPKLSIVKEAIVKWDELKKYKQHPVILNGGFKEFVERYPALVTNAHVNYIRNNEDIDELLELESIFYPDSEVSVMNLKEITIEKLEESFKTEEEINEVPDIEYPDIDQNFIKKEQEQVVPKGGEYIPEFFPEQEHEKDVEEIEEFKNEPSHSAFDIEEVRLKLLEDARKKKRKFPEFDNKENNVPEGPDGDLFISTHKRPPPVRRETKPQKFDTNRGWCGIYNIKNICYMSTIMQCLKCVPIIKQICDPSRINYFITRQPVIFSEFVNMIATLWEGMETDVKVTKPYPFYNTVCKLDDTYGKGRHEDCMEFFLFLLNHLNDDCSKEMVNKGGMSEREKAWYNHLQGRRSLWVDFFYYQIKCTKNCEVCKTKATTYETDNTLMLSVPHQTKYRTIHMKQLIREYMKDNHIMDYKCSKCHQMEVINSKSVVGAPEILVIVLKRYYQDEYGDMKKNNIPVEFENDLEFGGSNYKLCSIAQHMGTIDVGHYFAAGLITDGWVQFNDDRVTRITDTSGLSVTACAFFYTKLRRETGAD